MDFLPFREKLENHKSRLASPTVDDTSLHKLNSKTEKLLSMEQYRLQSQVNWVGSFRTQLSESHAVQV